MFKWFTNLFCSHCMNGSGALCEVCERKTDPCKHPYATATTPDDLIKARSIVASYKELLTQKKAADEAAAKALKIMKEEESKWDLAEKLLGLKRKENRYAPSYCSRWRLLWHTAHLQL